MSRGERFWLQREQRGVESAGRWSAEPLFMLLDRDTPRYDTPRTRGLLLHRPQRGGTHTHADV